MADKLIIFDTTCATATVAGASMTKTKNPHRQAIERMKVT